MALCSWRSLTVMLGGLPSLVLWLWWLSLVVVALISDDGWGGPWVGDKVISHPDDFLFMT